MPDNLKDFSGVDGQRINVNQDHELDYWSKKFEVTKEELKKAVAEVGPMVKNVEKFLKA